MHGDITSISELIHLQRNRIDLNISAAFEDMEAITESSVRVNNALYSLNGKCGSAERDLREEREMQVLFCQQFAYAPDMVSQCKGVLTCRQTKREQVKTYYQGPNYSDRNTDFDEIYARYTTDAERDGLLNDQRNQNHDQHFPAPAPSDNFH